MKKKWFALVSALAIAGSGISQSLISIPVAKAAEGSSVGTTYYVSSIHGDNGNAGTSENAPWETLDKLEHVKLGPGDSVLLEKGSVFEGTIHLQNVSGTKEHPIKISSYGDKERGKPILNGEGQGIWYQDYVTPLDNSGHRAKGYVSSTILLYDVDFVEISDLEITNRSNDFDYFMDNVSVTKGRMDRTGVAGMAKDGGTMEHVYLEDLYIHDIAGNLEDKHMNNGGIQMNVSAPTDEAATGVARYDDIRIANCHVKDVSRAGIVVGYTYRHGDFSGAAISDAVAKSYGHTNVVIEGNYVQNAGNDAIVAMYAYRPLIQYNVSDHAGADLGNQYSDYWQPVCAAIWPWKCKDAVFQYNEAFDTVGEGNGDGQAWDVDWSDGTVYQYNYSHNNGGGAVMFCLEEAYRGVFRYNISQNDLRCLLSLPGNPLAKIYNNVFYIGGDLTTAIYHPTRSNRDGEAYLANNIFYNVSTNKTMGAADNQIWNPDNNKQFERNLYYGYDADGFPELPEENAITADPMFAAPGTGPGKPEASGAVHSPSAFEGYKIAENSPAVNAGVFVEGTAKYDFFGAQTGVLPDIGIQETIAEEPLMLRAMSWDVEDYTIKGVSEGTTVEVFKDQLIFGSSVVCKVMNGTVEASGQELVDTDMKVQIYKESNPQEIMEYGIEVKEEELSVLSALYTIEGQSIHGVKKGTLVSELLNNLLCSTGISCKVLNGEVELESSDIVTDGCTVRVFRIANPQESQDFTVYLKKIYTEYDPATMAGTVGSYQKNNDTEGNANLALDDNLATMWHTDWNGCSQDEVWIQLDLGSVKEVSMVKYVPRQSGGANGIFTEYEVLVSRDGTSWTKAAEGQWNADMQIKYAYFDETSARYVKLAGLKTTTTQTGKIFGSAAEIRVGYVQKEG